jgi:hypothetical protein
LDDVYEEGLDATLVGRQKVGLLHKVRDDGSCGVIDDPVRGSPPLLLKSRYAILARFSENAW